MAVTRTPGVSSRRLAARSTVCGMHEGAEDRSPRTEIVSSISEDRLARQIEEIVRTRTGQAVRQLSVVVADEGVLLRGSCESFYSKQLAQEAAMNFARTRCVTNEIAVKEVSR